jgi:hypothetical protein
LIIGAVVAVIAILVLLYKKWTPFRELVNSIAEAMKRGAIAVWKFIKLLATDPGAAWEKTKKAFWTLVDMAEKAVKRIPGILRGWLNKAVEEVVAFGGRVKQGFLDLAGRILSSVSAFVGRVIDWFTFRNVGHAIGWLIGTAVKYFLILQMKVLGLVLKLVSGVINFFASLPRKVGYFIGFMIGKVLGLFIKLAAKALPVIGRLVVGIFKWFAKLPGRVRAFVLAMIVRSVTAMVNFARRLPELARQAKDGVVNWFRELPGKIIAFIVRMMIVVPQKLKAMKTKMIDLAEGMLTGFVNAMVDLPSMMGDIIDKMIQLVKDSATAAFNAVSEFAGGMWDGFKDGLGIHSPSYMEKAMWQITGVLDTETKKLAKKTMEVQKLSKKMAQTQFGVGGGAFDVPKRNGYVGLASMHDRNQNRARTLQDSSRKRTDSASKGATTKNVKVETTVNNPKPERAGQSVSKVLKNKVEEAGWR